MHHLKPQAESLLFAAVLLLLHPIQIEEVDRVLQSVGLNKNDFIVEITKWTLQKLSLQNT